MRIKTLKSCIKSIYSTDYNIGFIESDLEEFWPADFESFKISWLDWNGFKGRWYADPFILKLDDEYIYVLVEEFVYHKRGRISVLKIKRAGYVLEEIKPLLDLDTHLSFPIIFEEGGKTYIYPENYESGALKIYELDKDTLSIGEPETIIPEPLLDTQIVNISGKYYAFGIKFDKGLIPDTSRLEVYCADLLKGPYSHIQTIMNDYGYERGAGVIFRVDDKIIRPAQNCYDAYGKEVIFYELTFNDGVFNEKEISRFSPQPNSKWNRKLHTFNYKDGVIVVDGNDYRYGFLGEIVSNIIDKVH